MHLTDQRLRDLSWCAPPSQCHRPEINALGPNYVSANLGIKTSGKTQFSSYQICRIHKQTNTLYIYICVYIYDYILHFLQRNSVKEYQNFTWLPLFRTHKTILKIHFSKCTFSLIHQGLNPMADILHMKFSNAFFLNENLKLKWLSKISPSKISPKFHCMGLIENKT